MSETKIVLRNVRLSYANVWEPRETLNGDLKYSASLIIPKTDTKQITLIEKAIEAAKIAGKANLVNKKGVMPSNLKNPLRDGDADRADDPCYEGCYFINANSNNQLGIVNKKVQPILDRKEVYSGCYANVAVNFYAYNKNGNVGIGAGLGNIQKVKDGDILAGGSRPEDDFTVVDDDDDENMFD